VLLVKLELLVKQDLQDLLVQQVQQVQQVKEEQLVIQV
jgi:hypothetical protein